MTNYPKYRKFLNFIIMYSKDGQVFLTKENCSNNGTNINHDQYVQSKKGDRSPRRILIGRYGQFDRKHNSSMLEHHFRSLEYIIMKLKNFDILGNSSFWVAIFWVIRYSGCRYLGCRYSGVIPFQMYFIISGIMSLFFILVNVLNKI